MAYGRTINTKTTAGTRAKAEVAINRSRRLQAQLDDLMDIFKDRDHFLTMDMAKAHDDLTRLTEALEDVVTNRRPQ